MFYTISQNNVHGYTIVNDIVADYIIVEADNLEEGVNKILEITAEHDNYCECCGGRWDRDIHNEDGDEVPSIYEQAVVDWIEHGTKSVIIYYQNGVIESIQ